MAIDTIHCLNIEIYLLENWFITPWFNLDTLELKISNVVDCRNFS